MVVKGMGNSYIIVDEELFLNVFFFFFTRGQKCHSLCTAEDLEVRICVMDRAIYILRTIKVKVMPGCMYIILLYNVILIRHKKNHSSAYTLNTIIQCNFN